jgi:hypothetical protein
VHIKEPEKLLSAVLAEKRTSTRLAIRETSDFGPAPHDPTLDASRRPSGLQAAIKCDETIKRIRELKKGFQYELRMAKKNDSNSLEYQQASDHDDDACALHVICFCGNIQRYWVVHEVELTRLSMTLSQRKEAV